MIEQLGAGQLSVAVIQMNSTADVERNIAEGLELIDRAAATGARLVTMPEVWTYLGENAGVRAAAVDMPGDLTEQLAERARRHGIYLHAGSIYETVPGDPRVRNTTVVFDPSGEIVAKYSKLHMFDVVLDGVASFEESAAVKPGDEIVTFDLDGITVGLAICYDLRFPELFRILALKGAEVIMLPAAFTLTTGKDHWEVLIRARAIENGVYMVASGQVGTYDGGQHWCYGRSMVVDPWGTVLATAPDEVGVITATLSQERVQKVRRQVPSLANRLPDRYVWPETAGALSVR